MVRYAMTVVVTPYISSYSKNLLMVRIQDFDKKYFGMPMTMRH